MAAPAGPAATAAPGAWEARAATPTVAEAATEGAATAARTPESPAREPGGTGTTGAPPETVPSVATRVTVGRAATVASGASAGLGGGISTTGIFEAEEPPPGVVVVIANSTFMDNTSGDAGTSGDGGNGGAAGVPGLGGAGGNAVGGDAGSGVGSTATGGTGGNGGIAGNGGLGGNGADGGDGGHAGRCGEGELADGTASGGGGAFWIFIGLSCEGEFAPDSAGLTALANTAQLDEEAFAELLFLTIIGNEEGGFVPEGGFGGTGQPATPGASGGAAGSAAPGVGGSPAGANGSAGTDGSAGNGGAGGVGGTDGDDAPEGFSLASSVVAIGTASRGLIIANESAAAPVCLLPLIILGTADYSGATDDSCGFDPFFVPRHPHPDLPPSRRGALAGAVASLSPCGEGWGGTAQHFVGGV